MSCLGVDWNISEVGGVDYLSLDQVGKFYNLKKSEEAGRVTLGNKQLILDFEAGSQLVVFNKVNFSLKYPVLKVEELFLVSKNDLFMLIDPVLRPSQLEGLGEIETIIFDLGEGGGSLGRKIEEGLKKRGFKAIILDEKAGLGNPVKKIISANEGEGDLYVRVIVKEGREGSIWTNTLGKKTRVSLALATPLHWGIKTNSPLELADGGISIGDDLSFKGLGIPGVMIEVAVDPEEVGEDRLSEFETHISAALVESLHFVRNSIGDVGDKPKTEK